LRGSATPSHRPVLPGWVRPARDVHLAPEGRAVRVSRPRRITAHGASNVLPAVRPDTTATRLTDGRDLAWIEVGSPDGVPLFVFHGCPGRSYEFAVYDQTASESGVRLIAVDRPGYGYSTYQPRRKLSDFPGDVAQLADHLGVETFSVIGHSQGGPHALVCARFLPERVLGCAVVSGVAPPLQTNLTEGMMTTNRIQQTLYRRWPPGLDPLALALGWLVAPILAVVLRSQHRHPESGLDRFAKMLPACDIEVMHRPEIWSQHLDEVREFTPAVARSAVQDMALGYRDWDFRVEDIEVPVHIWHGDLDRNVPISHGRLLAKLIPNATLHECPGDGHWLVVDHMGEILNVLVGAARGGGLEPR